MSIIYRVVFTIAPTLAAVVFVSRGEWDKATFFLVAAHINWSTMSRDEIMEHIEHLCRLANETNEGILDRMRQIIDRSSK